MRRTAPRLGVLILSVIAWISVLSTVAAAGDSADETLIRSLSTKLIYLAVTITLIVEGALLYALLRYRNSGEAQPAEYNPRFHATYVLAVGLILFFVGFASFQTLGALDQQGSQAPSDDAVQIDVVAEQWAWTFEYHNASVSSQGTLVVPANQTIHLSITSRDVIHSFHAPDLGIRQDANPAQRNNITFTPTNTGEYDLFCAEYCGQGHSAMLGTIRVVNSSEYESWLEEQSSNSTAVRSDQSSDSRSEPLSHRSSHQSLPGETTTRHHRSVK